MEPRPQPRILPRCRVPAPGAARPRALWAPERPFVIAPARCNRCGACLRLGCGAISDAGGEALVVEADVCSGCGDCAPVCRAKAIGPGAASAGRQDGADARSGPEAGAGAARPRP